VRIAELSRKSGIPVPTIKYYLREGLLPPGELSSPNQARYGEDHLRRLQLVRALLEVGRLPIASIKEVLHEIDRPDPNVHSAMGHALGAIGAEEPDSELRHEVEELIARQGWQVAPGAPAKVMVAEVISTLRRLGATSFLHRLDEFAELSGRVGEIDLEIVAEQNSPEEMVYAAVLGAILGDRLLAGLRRLAQESASAKRYGHNAGHKVKP
jgi:DNA-binding transcriptional MerR regulator